MRMRTGSVTRIGSRLRRAAPPAALLVALLGVACASGARGGADGVPYGADSAEAAVRAFLDAAMRDDYREMARLFGSTSGPAERRLGRSEVEQRMFVLANYLKHRSYQVRPAGLSEGPGQVRLAVEMKGTRNGDVLVPFIAATHGGRWYVERVVTDALTGRI